MSSLKSTNSNLKSFLALLVNWLLHKQEAQLNLLLCNNVGSKSSSKARGWNESLLAYSSQNLSKNDFILEFVDFMDDIIPQHSWFGKCCGAPLTQWDKSKNAKSNLNISKMMIYITVSVFDGYEHDFWNSSLIRVQMSGFLR